MLLTIENVMDRLQLSRVTIYKMIDDGELEFFKVGRSLRLEERDFEKYIEKQKKAATEKRGQTFKKEIKKKRNLRAIM